RMTFQGLDRRQAQAVWQPFLGTVAASSDLGFASAPRIPDIPPRHIWDPVWLRARNAVLVDDRPGAPPENVFWAGNLGEAGHFLHRMESLSLPRSLLQLDRRAAGPRRPGRGAGGAAPPPRHPEAASPRAGAR